MLFYGAIVAGAVGIFSGNPKWHDYRALAGLWLWVPVFAEMSRFIVSVTVCLVGLMILLGFRLWLYWERRSDLQGALTLKHKLQMFWSGLRLDGVIVSRGGLPLGLTALAVMESFTGQLTGCLDGTPALSPELDKLAQQGPVPYQSACCQNCQQISNGYLAYP